MTDHSPGEASTKRPPRSYLVNGGLASAVAYFAIDLSRSGRGVVDWVVLALIFGAVSWNLVQLGGRLHAAGGGPAVWHLLRMLIFWTCGLSGVLRAAAAGAATWQEALGWGLLVAAAFDSVALYRLEQSPKRHDAGAAG